MRRIFLLPLFLVPVTPALGQHAHSHPHDRAIEFPDVPGYHTLACDLHIHTVFSDGKVWPDIRVEEALRDGLDCIAITDHLEYQPHAADIPHPDRNRSYDIAARSAANHELIVLRGAEVTRRMPPGHSNAIFVDDVNRLLVTDSVEAFREAKKQNAFVFWNHPAWDRQKPDAMAALTELHRELIRDGMLHGIEVVNEHTYSDEALQIALDHGLTILGTSDVHGLIDYDYDVAAGGHRPVTLVLANDRSAEGIREGLVAGRTVVWYRDLLIGRPEHLVPLLDASVEVASASYAGESFVLNVLIRNQSDAPLLLRNRTGYTFHNVADVVTLEPNAVTRLQVKTLERLPRVDLRVEVLNAITAPATHPEITLEVPVG